MPLTPPNITETLFSEHEQVEAPPAKQETQKRVAETGTSLISTSAALLTYPSLTDVLSNFPIWPQVDQPMTRDLPTTVPTDPQHAATASMSAPGHVSTETTEQKRIPRGRPQQVPLPLRVDANKVIAEAYENGDAREVVHLTELQFLFNKMYHRHLTLMSLTLVHM